MTSTSSTDTPQKKDLKHTQKSIILFGFMGSGKSVTAHALSQQLGLERIDMDEVALALSECQTVHDVFAQYGEVRWREYEIAAAKSVSQRSQPAVIATGGGVVENRVISQLLGANSITFFLNPSFEIIQQRLVEDTTRPLFEDIVAAEALWQYRLPMYHKQTDYEIVDTGQSVEEIVQKIISHSSQDLS